MKYNGLFKEIFFSKLKKNCPFIMGEGEGYMFIKTQYLSYHPIMCHINVLHLTLKIIWFVCMYVFRAIFALPNLAQRDAFHAVFANVRFKSFEMRKKNKGMVCIYILITKGSRKKSLTTKALTPPPSSA